ncbi:MAG TPA: hypothetical protein VFI90_05125 [Rubrobacter sp.]|nr:hypothetical protein [Rubrobacter sp.]
MDKFVEYVKAHDYTSDYGHLKAGFIRKKLAEEQFAYQQQKRGEAEDAAEQVAEERAEQARQLEVQAKRGAFQEYIDAGFSPETFEADWPTIRARLAANKIAEHRRLAASPRDYVGGYVPSGLSEHSTPPSGASQRSCLGSRLWPLGFALCHPSTAGVAGYDACLNRGEAMCTELRKR